MTDPAPLRLAATSLPLRIGAAGLEVLMVRRNVELAFGGLWTFPGGAIDEDDGPLPPEVHEDRTDWADPGLVATAAVAASRETLEETGLVCTAPGMVWFSHWIPPRKHGPPKRFATWFFLAPEPAGELVLDTTENSDARWVAPVVALTEHDAGRFPLAVPTWVTLDDLRNHRSPGELIEATASDRVRRHHTRTFRSDAGAILVWEGDGAYDSGELDAPGGRNRVEMRPDGSVVSREVR